jgi:hypothetical protein
MISMISKLVRKCLKTHSLRRRRNKMEQKKEKAEEEGRRETKRNTSKRNCIRA